MLHPPSAPGWRLLVLFLGWVTPPLLSASDTLVLETAELTVKLAAQGAQLQSVVDRSSGHEYLWQNPSKDWEGPAPVLFPVIGSVGGRTIHLAGRSYPMPTHGFARTSRFAVMEHSAASATLSLRGGGEADRGFPCPYVLTVRYQLAGRTLTVRADVMNPGPEVLPASIGFHPGFNATIPAGGDAASRLDFESEGPLIQLKKDPTTGFLSGERVLWSAGLRSLPLTPEAPAPDAVVLASPGELRATLLDDRTGRRVQLRTRAPFLGVWRKTTPTAQFICLEPWWGTTDPVAPYGDFRAKPHLALIAPGATLSAWFALEFD